MAFCTRCGTEAEPTDSFCAACGNPIRGGTREVLRGEVRREPSSAPVRATKASAQPDGASAYTVEYRHCGSCGFEQWFGYPKCQSCGAPMGPAESPTPPLAVDRLAALKHVVASTARTLGVAAIVLGIVNGALYVGQEWWHADAMIRCDEMATQLNAIRDEMHVLLGQAGSNERYAEVVRAYQAKRSEYQALASVAYKRWYLVPRGVRTVPGRVQLKN